MNGPVSSSPEPDLIDRLSGLAPGSTTHALRHQRDKVVAATQGSYQALFDPGLPGLSLSERLLVAWYACLLTPAPALAQHYRERLEDEGADAQVLAALQDDDPARLSDPRSRAMLLFTRTLILDPVQGDQALLATLPAAGIATPAIVTLAQLIAFLSYQTRLVAGLAAMAAAPARAAAEQI